MAVRSRALLTVTTGARHVPARPSFLKGPTGLLRRAPRRRQSAPAASPARQPPCPRAPLLQWNRSRSRRSHQGKTGSERRARERASS